MKYAQVITVSITVYLILTTAIYYSLCCFSLALIICFCYFAALKNDLRSPLARFTLLLLLLLLTLLFDTARLLPVEGLAFKLLLLLLL
jgi:hypothetical protein